MKQDKTKQHLPSTAVKLYHTKVLSNMDSDLNENSDGLTVLRTPIQPCPLLPVLNQQLSLPDAATPLIMLGVSKNEHSLCEIFSCHESVFNTFTKSELRLSGALV